MSADRQKRAKSMKPMTPAQSAKWKEYRRIRRMVVSMRIHALGKRSADASTGITRMRSQAFYEGQENAMAQLLELMEPKS